MQGYERQKKRNDTVLKDDQDDWPNWKTDWRLKYYINVNFPEFRTKEGLHKGILSFLEKIYWSINVLRGMIFATYSKIIQEK